MQTKTENNPILETNSTVTVLFFVRKGEIVGYDRLRRTRMRCKRF